MVLTLTLAAGDLKVALDAAEKGDFETALAIWKPMAEEGNGSAQKNLAVLYCLGNGVEKDLKTCAYWAKKAYLNGSDTSRLWRDFELQKY